MKPKKVLGRGNDTDFQAFLDQFEVCAKVNDWNEEEKANQLILCMKEKALSNSHRKTRTLTSAWSKVYVECIRSLKLSKLCSRLEEERWEKLC